jgi:hypothetical protein
LVQRNPKSMLIYFTQFDHIQDFLDIGGSGILNNKYKSSPLLFLTTMYPEYDWLPWKFEKCPKNYWENVNNHKKFVEWAATQLNIQDMNDWYKVSLKVNKSLLQILI